MKVQAAEKGVTVVTGYNFVFWTVVLIVNQPDGDTAPDGITQFLSQSGTDMIIVYEVVFQQDSMPGRADGGKKRFKKGPSVVKQFNTVVPVSYRQIQWTQAPEQADKPGQPLCMPGLTAAHCTHIPLGDRNRQTPY